LHRGFTAITADTYQKLTQFSAGDHQREIDAVVERIEAWKQRTENDDPLDLSNLGLKAFPESLRSLQQNVEIVYLFFNEIKEVPPWIEELSSLQILGLAGNKLETLPAEIGSLRQLFYLSLDSNRLRTLPEALCQLPLEFLKLDDNPELRIPKSILGGQPEEILRYYFESRDDKGKPLLELKLLLVGRREIRKNNPRKATCRRDAG